jgi:hypothetical protein
METLMRCWIRRSSFGLATAALVASVLTAAEAGAQVGTAFKPLAVQTGPNYASIRVYVHTLTHNIQQMNSAGGVTVFAAASPNGAILARIPYFAPFRGPDPEQDSTYGWSYVGVPPGTYYVAVILGVVATPNIPASDWTAVVVPGACNTPPGIGLANREATGTGPNDVRLRVASWGGCASNFLVEVGTSPGSANVGTFSVPGGVLAASAVPAGSYYVRVRGQNQFGIGPPSAVFPVSVPACAPIVQPIPDLLTATVSGNQVTLNWTPGPPQPGGPPTFYEIALFAPSVPLEAWPRVLLPTLATSISASVPSGPYTVALVAGNSCGWWLAGTRAFTVP